MYEVEINTVRSKALSGGELISAIGRLAASSSRDDFERFVTPEAHSCPFRLRSLPALDAFQNISTIFGVTLIARGNQTNCGEIFRLFTRCTHDLSLNHAWTTWYACESAASLENCRQDISIFAGRRKEGYFSGLDLFHPSPAIPDIPCRKQFFDKAIATMGVSDKIATQIGDDVLYMKAAVPWKLVYPSHQISGGGNPLGFFACGFAGVEESLSAGDRLIQQFARKLLGVSFVAKLTGEGYNTVFRELNEHWHPWEIEVMGELSPEAIDILRGGEVRDDSPSRVPAFTWHCHRDWAAYGSIVIENGKRYLEIATDGGTLEMLQDRFAFLDDLHFTPVLA